MPRSATAARIRRLAAVAVLAAAALGGCGEGADEEAVREGLTVELGGVGYTVFITRQLNPFIPPDEAYYDRPPPPPGSTHWGVFLQACNATERPQQTTDEFLIVDNQGNEFEPIVLEPDNPFAYNQITLEPQACIPEAGGVADLGPAGAAMLLFELPLQVTENRPLTLEIESGGGSREQAEVELDL